ncbi:MAG TPA: A24 family peptidase, partial [Polyangiaceae bacterium]|nr:A24 family peptidase [Polyangiaceae bacterium]
YRLVRGRVGMGFGDAKLIALAGAWFGAIPALLVLFAGSIQGAIWAAVVYLVRGRFEQPNAVKEELEELRRAAQDGDEEAIELLKKDPLAADSDGTAPSAMAFGPFLILAILEYLFFGDLVRQWLLPSDFF